MRISGMDIVFAAFLLIWCYLLYLYIRRRTDRKKTNWIEVTAKVVYIDEKVGKGRHGGHITMYQPTLEYDWKGFKRTLRMDAWDSTAHYQIGDKIVLLVDSDNPSHYRYKNIFQEPAAKMIIGVLIMIATILIAKRK